MAAGEQQQKHAVVELGFAEKCKNEALLSPLLLPSKLGGKPAWLQWDTLPSPNMLACGVCSKQMIFLCQLYVPLELKDLHYHKTIFLFCCRNGSCSHDRFFIKAFRSQKEENDADMSKFDKVSDSELIEKTKVFESKLSLCHLCGCYGDKKCSSCRGVSYCCKDHQVFDWKNGHKANCSGGVESKKQAVGKSLLFNEYEIVTEPEPSKVVSNEDELKKYEKYIQNDNIKIDQQLEKDLQKMMNPSNDEMFLKFKERVSREPDQIIRYDLGGQPLWVSTKNIPADKDIPVCSCGSKRQFEFQVLPQMINYLGVPTTLDSLDWGTLCVYTCSENCSNGQPYKEEFVWKQDLSE